ncbi:LPD7 domain-containing protein [Moraxella bovis]|uniref:LPD7 domain-containing protein n=1 Tax=Moraxella bovis TaxID=476 RepID=UPI00099191EB|nr:LPD7 domain-containing protein [Moraxella bovis]OOR90557.1 hypothetical protein B0182_05005 [Moraxella bovis]
MSDNKKDILKGELLAHGADNYLHDPAKSMNYYAQIKKDDGTISERWGKDLESVIKDSGVQVGDTVVLAELGKEPVVVGDKTFHKTIWDLQRYEPVLDLPNAIEHDTERELQKSALAVSADKTKENEQEAPATPKKTSNLSDFEFELPSNIKNNYFGIVKNRYLLDQKTNYYDKDDKNQVNIAFEDRNKSLHTSRQDEKTIYAMLDMAQAKNWTAIKLKGTDEFKQKAWLEAFLRGIEVEGYEPNEKDLAELKARQAERTTNQVEMTAQKAPEIKQDIEQSKVETQKQESIKEPIVLDIPAYHTFNSEQQDKAYLDRLGADFAGVKMERKALNFNEAKENAKNFTGQELTNFHSGIKAVISNNSLSKMLSGKAYEKSVDLKTHLIAVSNADKLFENSIFGWQHEHKGADKNSDIGAVHRAIAPLKIDNEVYLAKLTIKEFAYDGNRVYSIEAVELENEKSPIPEMVANDLDYKAKTDRHNGALIDIIVQNAQEYNRENQKNVENLHNYNISINQDILDNALAMKENHYERGYTSEKEVLSDNYFAIDPKNDFYIANQLNKDVSEFKNHHYAIDRTSDTYFIKQMVNELNISDDVKRDFELKFNNRMTEQFYANDSYDMPHENFSLRNYAVLARSDLEQSLNKFNEPNRDLVIKSFDGLMVDYSKQVVAHQKSWLLSRANSEVALEPKKSATELKNDIRQIVQNGYRDGSIKSRDDLVGVLKERGFEIKENEKSISVSLPNSNQSVNLKGEMFTKGYDAVKSLKERLEPETLKQTYPTLKDSDIVHITAYKNKIFDENRNTPNIKVLQVSLVQLEDGVKSLAKGKELNLPNLPVNEIKPDIEVRTTDNHDKSRQI